MLNRINLKNSNPENRSIYIKQLAEKLGFDFCGVSKARFLEEEAPRLENWLNQGMHGKMAYMENYFDKRLDPTKLVDGAKSVISLMYNYFPDESLKNENNLKIAKYAYGKDYHFVIKNYLRQFLDQIILKFGECNARVFVDSAPVLERVWAKNAGLGWIGKNSLLLNKQKGSFFFLAEIIIDLEIKEDGPVQDYCGTCTKCIDACPTDAIPIPYVVDASRCISYLTIELKDQIPSTFEGKFEDWIFGCDICQDVCPWNKFSTSHKEADFEASQALKDMNKKEWIELTEELFQSIFRKSPLKRAKFQGISRNIKFVTESKEKKDGQK